MFSIKSPREALEMMDNLKEGMKIEIQEEQERERLFGDKIKRIEKSKRKRNSHVDERERERETMKKKKEEEAETGNKRSEKKGKKRGIKRTERDFLCNSRQRKGGHREKERHERE